MQDDELTRGDAYRRLFEESRDAICFGTLDGRLLDVNPAAVRLFGYASRDEMLGLDVGRDLYWRPEDRRRAEVVFLAQGFLEHGELELKTRDGRRLVVEATSTAVRGEGGETVGFRAILRDVTEARRTVEQLHRAQKMEAVGRLAGGVAHDFNNLLTAINGYAELLRLRLPEADERARQAVEEILRAGRRAGDLTRRLLSLSRRGSSRPRILDLNRAVGEFERLLQRVIGEDVVLETRLQPELWPILADASQIEQILLNVALNARDAMPEGGTLTVSTSNLRVPPGSVGGSAALATPDCWVRLRIDDTGAGMDEEVRARAFDPFFSTKEPGAASGLGLATVYSLASQLGGRVELESAPGGGTTVDVFLPRSAASDDPSESGEDSGESLPRGKETILVVEDEDAVRGLVRQVLELLGYDVHAAGEAAEARRLVGRLERPPDLLLTDVVMPGESGPTLARDLLARLPGLRVLFMSGYPDRETGAPELGDGGRVFLRKPFSPVRLAFRVRAALDQPAT